MQCHDSSNKLYHSFVFLYSARDSQNSLLDHTKIETYLKIGLSRIWAIRATYHGMDCVAMVSTVKAYRLDQISRLIDAAKYNKIDPDGLQIVKGPVIFCKAHTNEYDTCAQMVRKAVFNRQYHHGILLGDWTRSDESRSTINHKTKAANALLELNDTAQATDAAEALLDLTNTVSQEHQHVSYSSSKDCPTDEHTMPPTVPTHTNKTHTKKKKYKTTHRYYLRHRRITKHAKHHYDVRDRRGKKAECKDSKTKIQSQRRSLRK